MMRLSRMLSRREPAAGNCCLQGMLNRPSNDGLGSEGGHAPFEIKSHDLGADLRPGHEGRHTESFYSAHNAA